MKLFSSLEPRDRNLLLACFALTCVLVVLLVVFSPTSDDKDPTPYSDAATTHGAKAAYLLLGHAGYRIERWDRPLSALPDDIDQGTTLIIAQPLFGNVKEAQEPVKRFLERGGRVLVTGLAGGYLVPDNHVQPDATGLGSECTASPNAFNELSNSGDVKFRPEASWKESDPRQSTAYTCHGNAVVVTYKVGKGTVVWWASSLPLENSGIQHGDNLALLLNSIGPVGKTRVIWDESLHGDMPALWSYAQGTPIHLVWWQLAFVALVLLLSYARRRGPLRPDPVVTRATPIEFVQSLGELYRKAGATNTAVNIAYHQFRHTLESSFSIPRASLISASELSAALAGKFGPGTSRMEHDLIACEKASAGEHLPEKRALALVQALRDHEQFLRSKLHSVTKENRLGRNAS